jgi:hypothetical protein
MFLAPVSRERYKQYSNRWSSLEYLNCVKNFLVDHLDKGDYNLERAVTEFRLAKVSNPLADDHKIEGNSIELNKTNFALMYLEKKENEINSYFQRKNQILSYLRDKRENFGMAVWPIIKEWSTEEKRREL